MKNSTRKIFVSILTLVLTVVAVGTTTFAWFTIGNIATVSGISAEVIGGEGLETQLVLTTDNTKKTDFKNHLTAADWTLVRPAGFKFTAVEFTNDEYTKLGVITDNTALRGQLFRGVETIANVEYLSVTINFRSLSAGTVALTNLTFTEVDVEGFEAGVEYTGVNGNTIGADDETPKFNGANALRVSFTGGTTNNLTYRNDHSVLPNLGQWSYLNAKNNNIYNLTTPATQDDEAVYEHVNASPGYSGVKFDNNGVTVALVAPGQGEDYYTASLTMVIWVDGWDPHTFDAIYELLLGLSLTFEKN